MEQGTCRSCKKPILWVKMAMSQRIMPLDAQPTEDGKVVVVDGQGVTLTGDLFEEKYDGPRYTSHFATCPWADNHRKRD